MASGVEDVRSSEIGEEAELINRRQQESGLERKTVTQGDHTQKTLQSKAHMNVTAITE